MEATRIPVPPRRGLYGHRIIMATTQGSAAVYGRQQTHGPMRSSGHGAVLRITGRTGLPNLRPEAPPAGREHAHPAGMAARSATAAPGRIHQAGPIRKYH